VRGSPLAFAQRPFPSIMMAMWRGLDMGFNLQWKNRA
jgi:hypothetical protein